MEGVRRWWQELTGLVLPAECGGCGRARTVLCPQCRAALGGSAPRRVRPVPAPPGLPAVHAAARYADEVRAMLLAHKERGALTLARPLGVALAGAVWVGLGEVGEGEGPPSPGHERGVGPGYERGFGPGYEHGRQPGPAPGPAPGHRRGFRPGHHVLLVPVPSAPRAVRARGHDPARRIALAAAGELRRLGVSVRVAAVLRQRRVVADQSGLSSRQRLENLVGALTVVPGGARVLCGGPVVVVDDLVTTGASLAEAARAVRAAVAQERSAGRAEVVRAGGAADGVAEAVASGRAAGTVLSGRGGGAVAWTERGEGAMAVYGGVTREGREVRPSGAREGGAGLVPAGPVGAGGAGEVVCAAVVAAPPDSFEIDRNCRRT
ncbi:ComF family protein [Streptomyces sp. NPDC051315]|uniref:ComF family protein n=1 Tax=Streptomyces sp. NPDC051315 TaxID=3365650 RepID=UPI0037A4F4E9